jgi:hypothetical protein
MACTQSILQDRVTGGVCVQGFEIRDDRYGFIGPIAKEFKTPKTTLRAIQNCVRPDACTIIDFGRHMEFADKTRRISQ